MDEGQSSLRRRVFPYLKVGVPASGRFTAWGWGEHSVPTGSRAFLYLKVGGDQIFMEDAPERVNVA